MSAAAVVLALFTAEVGVVVASDKHRADDSVCNSDCQIFTDARSAFEKIWQHHGAIISRSDIDCAMQAREESARTIFRGSSLFGGEIMIREGCVAGGWRELYTDAGVDLKVLFFISSSPYSNPYIILINLQAIKYFDFYLV